MAQEVPMTHCIFPLQAVSRSTLFNIALIIDRPQNLGFLFQRGALWGSRKKKYVDGARSTDGSPVKSIITNYCLLLFN